MKVLTVRERDRLKIGNAGQELPSQHAAALADLEPFLPPRALSWEHQAIRFGPYCGVIRVGSLTIEILPKVSTGLGNEAQSRGILIAMLRAAGELAVAPVGTGPLGLQKFHLLDVFIIDFCQRVHDLLRRGAIRSYETREENLAAVRGRILLSEDLRSNLFDRSHIFCRYDEFSVDNIHNQELKAALRRLLDFAVAVETKGAINALLLRMADVSTQAPSLARLESLRFDRITQVWQPVFDRSAQFLKGLYPDVRAGRSDNVCLLFDMERLFEAYVGVLIRRAWRSSTTARVLLQGPRHCFATAAAGKVFAMRPDAAVIEDGHCRRIYDTKWKRLSSSQSDWGVAQEDIYQMGSYASRYDCRHVSLIYPQDDQVSTGLIETFALSDGRGSRVDVFTLDLAALVSGEPLPEGLGPVVGSIQ
jgi:5-methylcytosine-specific restriction enzyme subunit McrC